MRLLELAEIDVERHAADAVDVEFERGDAAVERRPVVLQSGGHVDRLRLDVHRHLQQRFRLDSACAFHSASAAQTATFSAEDPAMPAPAGDCDDVVSVMPRASKKWTSSDSSRSSRSSRSSAPVGRFDRRRRCLRSG